MPIFRSPSPCSGRISPLPSTTGSSIRKGLGSIPAHRHGSEVAIIGAGMAGMTAAFELMKMGLKPVIYEAARIGGRLRSQPFEGAYGIIAELGGMRFPVSSTGFYHYVDMLGLKSKPFPNPLSPATPSTVIDLEGKTIYVEKTDDLPPHVQGDRRRLGQGAGGGRRLFGAAPGDPRARCRQPEGHLEPAHSDLGRPQLLRFRRHLLRLRRRGPSSTAKSSARWASAPAAGIRTIPIPCWKSCASSPPTATKTRTISWAASSRCRGACGNCRRPTWCIGRRAPALEKLHDGAPRPGVTRIERAYGDKIAVTDRWGAHQAL